MTDHVGTEPQPVPGRVLGIEQEHSGVCLIFHLRGDIDFETAAQLREAVLATTDGLAAPDGSTPPHLVLDLGRVAYCDSSGLSALVSIWKAARAAAGGLILADVPEQARRILSHTGIDRYLVIRPTVAEAVAELSN